MAYGWPLLPRKIPGEELRLRCRRPTMLPADLFLLFFSPAISANDILEPSSASASHLALSLNQHPRDEPTVVPPAPRLLLSYPSPPSPSRRSTGMAHLSLFLTATVHPLPSLPPPSPLARKRESPSRCGVSSLSLTDSRVLRPLFFSLKIWYVFLFFSPCGIGPPFFPRYRRKAIRHTHFPPQELSGRSVFFLDREWTRRLPRKGVILPFPSPLRCLLSPFSFSVLDPPCHEMWLDDLFPQICGLFSANGHLLDGLTLSRRGEVLFSLKYTKLAFFSPPKTHRRNCIWRVPPRIISPFPSLLLCICKKRDPASSLDFFFFSS